MKMFKTIAAALVAVTLSTPAFAGDDKPKAVKKDPKLEQAIKRGEYLVSTAGCHDCHTPKTMTPQGPVPDMTKMLSGSPAEPKLPPPPKPAVGPWAITATGDLTAWSGPWGTSFARNLTPDKETGLGEWTEQNFLDTIKMGKRMGKGRMLLPPMPVEVLQKFTEEDQKAIFAYLRTIAPIKNAVREPEPPAAAAAAAPAPVAPAPVAPSKK